MPKFIANLNMLFTELPFLERFAAASRAGFEAIEFMFPYDYPVEVLKEALDSAGLKLVLFNLPAGDWNAGERGIAAYPGRQAEFRDGVEKAVAYAKVFNTPRINCLVGKQVPGHTDTEQRTVLVENLRFAAMKLQNEGVKLLVEPVNHFDIPGFLLNKTQEALNILAEVNHPNLFIQYDIYHAQREEGELAATLRAHMAKIQNIQIADNPGRHQPGTGEINYRFLLWTIDALGYDGYVSMEYIPSPNTEASLRWLEEHSYKLRKRENR